MFSIVEAARSKGTRACVITCVFLALIPVSDQVHASQLEAATSFLLQSQRSDGAIAGSADIATAEQATAEALAALEPGSTVDAAALAFLDGSPLESRPTEYLARYIAVSDGGTTAARDELLTRQNADGGFGAGRNLTSSALDTAYALEGLVAADLANAVEAQRAATYLLNGRTNSGWSNSGGTLDAALTLRAWHALFPLRHIYPSVDTALDAALNPLDGVALHDDFLVAQHLHARMLRAHDASEYTSSLQSFEDRQQADGSWSSDVYSTALAMHVLRAAADDYPNPDLGSVRGRVIDGEYGTALANVTVMVNDKIAMTDVAGVFVVDGLSAGTVSVRIEADGYAELSSESQSSPGQQLDLGDLRLLRGTATAGGALQGVIKDAGTDAPLEGSHVSLRGSEISASSNADGQFTLSGLAAGEHTFDISRSGFESTSIRMTIVEGGVHVISIALNPQGTGRFEVIGTVTDGETGLPLSGVTIHAGEGASATALTDSEGNFHLADLPSGSVTLTAALTGYRTASASVEARDGQIVNFSPALHEEGSAVDSGGQTGISATVVDVTSGAVLAGATATLTADGTTHLGVTDASGRFEIIAPAGIYRLTLSNEGYRELVSDVRLADNVVLDLGETGLSPHGYYPPITILGTVLDSSTSEPLPSANVSVIYDDGQSDGVADAEGRFAISASGDRSAIIQVSAPGYTSLEWKTMLASESLDLGQLRLRPEGLDSLLPDLALALADITRRVTDPDTLNVSGTVSVAIDNKGRKAVTQAFDVIAFLDVDGNGSYSATSDMALGKTQHAAGLPAGESAILSLALNGKLPFRDAPIHFAADAPNHIVEVRNDNNIASTLDACRIQPDDTGFSGRTKWAWSGGRVSMTPLSAPLIDTNGDGLVNVKDDIFVVFVFSNGFPDNAPGTLVAVNGKTGEEAWRHYDPAFDAPGQLAIGDIDGDGLPEILGTRRTYASQGLIAVNGNGTLKWQSRHPTYKVGHNYGGPALADLDGDGRSEIIIDRTVLNHDGSLRWVGSENVYGGRMSFAADIDLDGRPEVIVGPSAYDADGNLLWRAPIPDGKAAVANFNDDPYPEIVVAGSGKMHLLSHTGEVLWGPVAYDVGGGGAPVVGDVDGDGTPEIGVNGQALYYLFNADGSVRWTSPIWDASRSAGSTMFDFDGDGYLEVLFADHSGTYVIDGMTGERIHRFGTASVTAGEYPIVADIDGDNSADIVAPTYIPSRAIMVFENVDGNWMDARPIWNQYAYHVTNINDDMSIPPIAANNWETFNNFRVNAIPDATRVADVSAALFALQDKGAGQAPTATLRVGNGGGRDANDVLVRIHTSDPASGGTLWAETVVPSVPAGGYVDIELQGASVPAQPLSLHAEVNADGSVPECVGHNNSVTLSAIPVLGEVSVVTDAATYAPESDARLVAVVENTGSFTRAFEAQLRIEDAAGDIVAELPRQALGELASGEQRVVQDIWNTARYLAGDYRLRGMLYAGDGELLASDTTGFAIAHDATASPLAALRLSTDRARYHTTDQVRIDLLAQNQSVSTLLGASTVRATVVGPAGQVVFDQALNVRELGAGNNAALSTIQLLNAVATGDYAVTAAWRDAGGNLLAAAERNYAVYEDLAKALQGSVMVSMPELYVGESLTCTERVANAGTQAAAVNLRRTLARLDAPSAQTAEPFAVTLPAGEEQTWLRGVDTAGMQEGDYACVLEAEIDASWQPLASAFFRLLPPPIRIDASMNGGDRGRLLVLLDPACADLDPAQADGAACDADPYGPGNAPPLPIQREHLEAVLEAAGWTFTIVTDAESFATEFASRGYEVFALFNEQLKLPEALQRDVVADIASGRGLLVAGNHDRRNGRLEEALGMKSLGKNLRIEKLVVQPFGEHEGGEIPFNVAHWPNALRLEGAEVLGEFELVQKGRKPAGNEPALTRNAHGDGTGSYAAFDWPAQSAAQGDDGELAGLLTATLDVTHPEPYAPIAGRVISLQLALQNEGIATPGEVHFALPPGVALVAGPESATVADGIVRWPFTLAEAEQENATLWLQLPATSGPLTFEAVIHAGEGDSLTEHVRTQIVLNVLPQE